MGFQLALCTLMFLAAVKEQRNNETVDTIMWRCASNSSFIHPESGRDRNQLFQVSADVLKASGYTNQFRTLLTNQISTEEYGNPTREKSVPKWISSDATLEHKNDLMPAGGGVMNTVSILLVTLNRRPSFCLAHSFQQLVPNTLCITQCHYSNMTTTVALGTRTL